MGTSVRRRLAHRVALLGLVFALLVQAVLVVLAVPAGSASAAAGTITEFAVPTSSNSPLSGLAVGPDGNLWPSISATGSGGSPRPAP
jgi:hypothetical protein